MDNRQWTSSTPPTDPSTSTESKLQPLLLVSYHRAPDADPMSGCPSQSYIAGDVASPDEPNDRPDGEGRKPSMAGEAGLYVAGGAGEAERADCSCGAGGCDGMLKLKWMWTGATADDVDAVEVPLRLARNGAGMDETAVWREMNQTRIGSSRYAVTRGLVNGDGEGKKLAETREDIADEKYGSLGCGWDGGWSVVGVLKLCKPPLVEKVSNGVSNSAVKSCRAVEFCR